MGEEAAKDVIGWCTFRIATKKDCDKLHSNSLVKLNVNVWC